MKSPWNPHEIMAEAFREEQWLAWRHASSGSWSSGGSGSCASIGSFPRSFHQQKKVISPVSPNKSGKISRKSNKMSFHQKNIWKIWPSNVPKPRSFDISTLLYHWLHALFHVLKRLCDWCKQSLLQIGWQRPFLRPWINTLVLGKLLVAMDANHPIRLNPCCSSNCLKYRAKDFATHRCGKKNMFHGFSVINPWFQPDVW